MRFRADRYRDLRSLLRPDADRDVEEELRHHVEQSVADAVAGGMSEEAAREAALRRFGDMDRYRRETVALDEAAQREERRMQVLDAIRRETGHAVRSLFRTPVFTVVAIVTLGLGIGATAAIYTLIDSVVLRPLPYPQPDRVMDVRHAAPGVSPDAVWGTSVAQYFYYQEHNRSFEEFGGYSTRTLALSAEGGAERVDGVAATTSLLRVLGARTQLGRTFDEGDDEPGGPHVALLSHDLWQTHFDGDPGVLNREIRLNGTPHTIVGVLAPGFSLPGHRTKVWVPLPIDRTAQAVNAHWVSVYGRLAPGVTAEAAQRDLAQMLARLPEIFPTAYSQGFLDGTQFRPTVVTVREELLGGIDRALWILLASVGLVLLIAAGNVANLFLVRTEARRREIALRSSLGGERLHLAVHYVSESMLLALAAGLLGVFLAWAGVQLLVATAPAGVPRLDEIALRTPAVLLAFGIAALCGLAFGLFPVLRGRVDYGVLREGGRGLTASRRQHLVRNALVAGQMALALVLLAGGALLVKSYLNLRSVEDGIDASRVLTFDISVPAGTYPDHVEVHNFYREFTERVAALPGVEHVGGTSALPFDGGGGCAHTAIEATAGQARGESACVPTPIVLPGYFEALRIPVRGSTFDWGMLSRREGVAVISRALAERFFPGEDPIGKAIISYRDGPPWYRIIGVAEDVRNDGYDKPPFQAIYYPQMPMDIQWSWMPARSMTVTVRTAVSEPENLASGIRQIVREMDAEVPVADVRTMEEVIRRSEAVARASFTLLLLAVAAVVSLFLSAVGLYGVISYLVAQRRSEIGVRLALGARSDQVRIMVVLQALRIVGIGVLIGTPVALGGARLLRSILFGVSPADPAILATVTLLLLCVAGVASYIPAFRAAGTEPATVLRED